uniref:Uncharacterized protein n=1 Tax=Ralstonia pickettii (strain 12D) TaxID=428406 RepID=C6BPW0_RALP1
MRKNSVFCLGAEPGYLASALKMRRTTVSNTPYGVVRKIA